MPFCTFVVDGPEQLSGNNVVVGQTIIAMDAAVPDTLAEQCSGWVRDRDILKALCGFDGLSTPSTGGCFVATGNWGCGAFGGNPYAKFIHQVLAASLARVSLVYCLVGDDSGKLRADLTAILHGLQMKRVTAMELYQGLEHYEGRGELKDYLFERYAS